MPLETAQDIINYLETVLTPEGQPGLDMLEHIQGLLCDYREQFTASTEITEKITFIENWVAMLSLSRESWREVLSIKAMIIRECQSLKHIIGQILETLMS
jgi:hypothetical protein